MNTRFMIRRDLSAVLEIEDASFEFPWGVNDFLGVLRARNGFGLVVEDRRQVIGYAAYETHRCRLQLLSFAVAHEHRRRGAGTMLLKRLTGRLSANRRNRITCEVRETNLPALQFLKSQGWKAYDVLRGFYRDSDEDAYAMRYRCTENAKVISR